MVGQGTDDQENQQGANERESWESVEAGRGGKMAVLSIQPKNEVSAELKCGRA